LFLLARKIIRGFNFSGIETVRIVRTVRDDNGSPYDTLPRRAPDICASLARGIWRGRFVWRGFIEIPVRPAIQHFIGETWMKSKSRALVLFNPNNS